MPGKRGARRAFHRQIPGRLDTGACGPLASIIRDMALPMRGSIFLLSLLLAAAGCDRGDHPRQVGKPAPDFTISDGGRTLQLSSYRGRVVLLNFWASWCAPCVEEIPAL